MARKDGVDWIRLFNRLFELIDVKESPNYFSGPRFIEQVRRIDAYHPNYYRYIEERKKAAKSTTRRDYFEDLLLSFPEAERISLVTFILDELDDSAKEAAAKVRKMLSGAAPGPSATVPNEGWNADRLNEYLSQIDASLSAGDDERAVTLAYTCLEGFYKAFAAAHLPGQGETADVVDLAKAIKKHLKDSHACPDEILNMVTQVTHAVDKTRNQFSESHFAKKAEPWLAVYVRDLVNTQIRLLLHFL